MRLFVAINLPDSLQPVVDYALIPLWKAVSSLKAEVTWTAPDRLHITMKFLGDCVDHQIPRITEALDQVASGITPFSVALSGLGCFPVRGKPSIIWLGVSTGADQAGQVAADLETALQPLGFEREERPFSAHVTIGRVKRGSNGLQLRKIVEQMPLPIFDPFPVASIDLMQSVLQSSGPQYTRLHRASFGGGG